MKESFKREKIRDILCAGLNHIIENQQFDIKDLKKEYDQSVFVDLLGKKSKIHWKTKDYSEVIISVWWGIKPSCKDAGGTKPLNQRLGNALDVYCTLWLERQSGFHLQGKANEMDDFYCCKSAEKYLLQIPTIQPLGYNKEGPTF